ncbi:MAG: penicillin-binding protein 1C [Alphaproteobacteria bacterium]|jgi:penicillin-binding protein 1C|nr:penicillin-binding protein 1C [Alphaproteobacteria bacterium]
MRFRWLIVVGLALAAPVMLLPWLDARYPPDLSRLGDISFAVEDREGRLLRLFSTADDTVRLATNIDDVDPLYLDMLVAFEDKRFWEHGGVDPLAVLRAAGQAVANGRIVSGASTLTMQCARLLEPRPRTLPSKVIEMFRAWQLERRFDKREILGMYLTLAPFGGRLEGVRAGSLAYFGEEPRRLSPGQAALLVALLQAPSRLRPDRHPDRAAAARAKVLRRVESRGVIAPATLRTTLVDALPALRSDTPFLAPHLARRLRSETDGTVVRSTIDRPLQERLEALVGNEATRFTAAESIAVLVVDTLDRSVLAYVGSSDFANEARRGQVDMVSAVRSPGSALKPLIYGIGFADRAIHPATLIRDAPTRFGSYQPRNFRRGYLGEVSAAEALRLSLNVPAVKVLDRIGPVPLAERLAGAGIPLRLPHAGARPSLAMALGGVGVTLEELVRLYAALAGDGVPRPLRFTDAPLPWPAAEPLIGRQARDWVARILAGVPRPQGFAGSGGIAYKTGTSYGFRDAWAVGFDKRYTVGVWVGRADGTASPERTGLEAAAPILLRTFALLPDAGGLSAWNESMDSAPDGLARLERAIPGQAKVAAPSIQYPIDGSVLRLADLPHGLALEASGGQRPLAWLVNREPLPAPRWRRQANWQPDGPGFAQVTVIDALGRAAASTVRIVER